MADRGTGRRPGACALPTVLCSLVCGRGPVLADGSRRRAGSAGTGVPAAAPAPAVLSPARVVGRPGAGPPRPVTAAAHREPRMGRAGCPRRSVRPRASRDRRGPCWRYVVRCGRGVPTEHSLDRAPPGDPVWGSRIMGPGASSRDRAGGGDPASPPDEGEPVTDSAVGAPAPSSELVQLLTPEGERVEHPDYASTSTPRRCASCTATWCSSAASTPRPSRCSARASSGIWASLLGQEAAQIGSGRALLPQD